MGFFMIPFAGVGFFVSSFLLMIFWGIIAPDFGVETIGYKMAMLITIAIWLAVAPLVAATVRRRVEKMNNSTLSRR
jgi:Na+/melibiose symporter-like transporter